ncbi:MAG TPA: RDD family protein [Flavihumibacter sp.]|jgi:uncharacterized RDD family membrane protein YckC
MPVTRLHTGFNIEIEFTLSAFHKRLLAWIVDLVVIYLYFWIFYRFLNATGHLMGMTGRTLFTFICYLPVLLYSFLFEWITNGQTPGKMLLRIKVIAASGGQASVSQYLIRWLFRLVDFPFWIFAAISYQIWPWYIFPVLFAGLACFILTPKSQRIGDLLADTIVIDTNTRSDWKNTVFTEVEEDYQPQFPMVMNLSDRDMNTIKQVLMYSRKKPGDTVADQVARKVQSALKIETELDTTEFLEALLKDYNYLSRQ